LCTDGKLRVFVEAEMEGIITSRWWLGSCGDGRPGRPSRAKLGSGLWSKQLWIRDIIGKIESAREEETATVCRPANDSDQ